MLEIQVGGVDRRPHEAREHAIEVAAGEAAGREQPLFGEGKQCHVGDFCTDQWISLGHGTRTQAMEACAGSQPVPRLVSALAAAGALPGSAAPFEGSFGVLRVSFASTVTFGFSQVPVTLYWARATEL